MTMTQQQKWEAVVRHDTQSDGHFFYAVKTTGIFCYPSCSARRPKPENILYFDSAQEAVRAGFRPCKRCFLSSLRPNNLQQTCVIAACRYIENAHHSPSLDELADYTGMSKYHFHRVFKRALGLTPGEYIRMQKKQRVRQILPEGETVTDAIYGAGFGSGSRFYENSDEFLGMKPAIFKAGGKGMSIRYAIGECYLGNVLAASSERGICAVLLGDNVTSLLRELKASFPLATLFPDEITEKGGSHFSQTLNAVLKQIENPAKAYPIPLDIQGTAFQQRIWKALRTIPAGETISYGELAKKAEAGSAIRAVANACAANKLAILIPCHRVIRQDGALSGYRWGAQRKKKLLSKEKAMDIQRRHCLSDEG